MTTLRRLLVVLLLCSVWDAAVYAACSGSSPTWTAASTGLTDVAACHTAATAGDTINVPAGSSTWTSTLTITKGVTLTGAGIGSTVITNGVSGVSYLISYTAPSNAAQFRLSGFTFDANNKYVVYMQGATEPVTANVRIDHNRFTNSTQSRSAIFNSGTFGVIDHNSFDLMEYPLGVGNSVGSVGSLAWAAYADTFHGTAENIYVEDNTFSNLTRTLSDCDQGGRYVFRYNTLNATADMFPYLDIHEGGAGYGCMGTEVYGNLTNRAGRIQDNQGNGRSVVHHNLAIDGSITIRSDGSGGCSTPLSARQFLNNTYIFRNRVTATGALIGVTESTDICGIVNENNSYWDDATSFDGTTGTGAGTLASRPATCTTGVAYWATTQSTTDLTGMVGVNPSTPISGTLYKCTATDTWTSWYTPYAYPHPLQGTAAPKRFHFSLHLRRASHDYSSDRWPLFVPRAGMRVAALE